MSYAATKSSYKVKLFNFDESENDMLRGNKSKNVFWLEKKWHSSFPSKSTLQSWPFSLALSQRHCPSSREPQTSHPKY